MERIMTWFRGRIRRWREDKPGGLAVIDIPDELVAGLGGRRQMRVASQLNGAAFTGSTMLVAGGGFCVGVSRAALQLSGVSVGDEVDVQLERANGIPAWHQELAERYLDWDRRPFTSSSRGHVSVYQRP
jgi:hypothetical protein